MNKLINKYITRESKRLKLRAFANGSVIPCEQINDHVFSNEILGPTVAIEISDSKIVAPCSGILEVMYPTGHAFAIRTDNGDGILVHIGIDTVSLDGKGFAIKKKQGDYVSTGDIIVTLDLSFLKVKDVDTTTMMVLTEKINESTVFEIVNEGKVKIGEVIAII